MIEQKVGRTSVFYLRLQIMNPWKWQAQTEAVRSSISLGTIHWLKVAACFRVTSNGGGWKVVRKREWRGRKEMRMPLWRSVWPFIPTRGSKDRHLHSKNSHENVHLDVFIEPPFSSCKKIFESIMFTIYNGQRWQRWQRLKKKENWRINYNNIKCIIYYLFWMFG